MKQRSGARVLAAAAVLLLVAGSAWWYLAGRRFVIRLTEAELRENLESRLPFTRTYLLVVPVTFESPRVSLEEGSDRITAGLDVTVSLSDTDPSLALRGSIDASSALRYEASTGELHLVDPVILGTSIRGLSERNAERVNDVLERALAEYCRIRPIYTLRRTGLRRFFARLVLRDVVVEDGQLVVTLGID